MALAAGLAATLLLYLVQAAGQRSLEEARLRRAAAALAPLAAPLFADTSQDATEAVSGWAAASGLRVTLIRADGTVHADSDMVAEFVTQMENHGARPEVVAARSEGEGIGQRRSRTTNRSTLYVAQRLGPANRPEGFVRVAWEEPLAPLPFLPLLAAFLIALTAGVTAQRLVRRQAADVAAHLAPWAELSVEEDPEALAEEADRRWRSIREELLREVEATRAAVAEVSEGVILLDRAGMVRFANPAAVALIGSDLAVGRALVEAVRAPELVAAVAEVAADGEPRHSEFSMGTGTDIAVRVCPVPHPVLATAIVLRDVRGERQLERARRALVADLAHELRTPLTVLGGLAEEFRETGAETAPVETLERQVRRLMLFAEDLEELAAAEAGRLSLHVEAVDASAVAREVIADLSSAAEQARVSVQQEGESVRIMTDPTRLAQLLANVVDNAIRYNREGGHVSVRTELADGERVRIAVEDDGLGIPEDELPLVFQRFYRVRRGRATGSGLGLAIVKHVVRALGGTVQLASTEGRGTTVTFLLPRRLSEPRASCP